MRSRGKTVSAILANGIPPFFGRHPHFELVPAASVYQMVFDLVVIEGARGDWLGG